MALVLVINAGSSSLKFSLFGPDGLDLSLHGLVEEIGRPRPRFLITAGSDAGTVEDAPDARDHAGAFDVVARWLERWLGDDRPAVVGHRVVHGGDRFAAPLRVDEGVLAALDALIPLAPLHEPQELAAIRAVAARWPEVPQVACFDTAFHRGRPPVAEMFALPLELHASGIRRYGFHGLSYEAVAEALPRVAPAVADGRVVVAHLGAGASLCALRARRSVDTTMTFSALDGLPMATRVGDLDPAVVLYLQRARGMSVPEVEALLYERSGLLGISGISADVRELLASSDARARLALDHFVFRVVREVGALASVLGGLDAVVFTAGIGEHAAPIRAAVCEGLAWLGVVLDPAANADHGPRISTPGARVSAWVIPTDEERVIARHTLALL